MSCWRVLTLLKQPGDEQVPPLLVKPTFNPDSYIVHLTDLSNIWCEELGLDDIVDRASQEQSPIEASKQDPAQLAVLLENIAKPLHNAGDATCRITRNEEDSIILHTTISLPEPLGRLQWRFHLQKRTSTALKNELILTLFVSSHIQNERIASLIKTIASKDNAINRLLDQFDATNMDLAAAFPSVGGTKAGRRTVKREQAAKHVPALRPFHEDAWRQDTGHLEDSDLTSLGLFQEALAQTTPKVPEKLKSENIQTSWWTSVPTQLAPLKISVKPTSFVKSKDASESSDEETEDEFDTHENFKVRNNVSHFHRIVDFAQTRNIPPKPTKVAAALTQILPLKDHGEDESDSTEEENDLDAPPKSYSQNKSQDISQSVRQRSSSPDQRSSPVAAAPSATKPKASSFRIGGKPQRISSSPTPLPDGAIVGANPDIALMTRESVPPASQQTEMAMTPRKLRKPFRIGGKARATEDNEPSQLAVTASPSKNRTRDMASPTIEPPSSPPQSQEATQEAPPVEEVQEETPEEKAERRRAELKRRNEEAAKKQAQQKKKKKKKKRF